MSAKWKAGGTGRVEFAQEDDFTLKRFMRKVRITCTLFIRLYIIL